VDVPFNSEADARAEADGFAMLHQGVSSTALVVTLWKEEKSARLDAGSSLTFNTSRRSASRVFFNNLYEEEYSP